jgi:hypothetical protein
VCGGWRGEKERRKPPKLILLCTKSHTWVTYEGGAEAVFCDQIICTGDLRFITYYQIFFSKLYGGLFHCCLGDDVSQMIYPQKSGLAMF